jgi:glycosyltransferase involved in cell wall biosynthesis
MPDPTLSVVVITRNEAHRIARCLESIPFADERIVVDSGSTDDTVAIARRLGAHVLSTGDWPGFGPQKNRALSLASGRWVLSLDADEQATPDLAASIRALLEADARGEPLADAWWITRESRWCGRRVRFGDWRNDRVLRLFRRGHARFSDDLVHERLLCEGATASLPGVLLHDSVDSPEDAREKSERYARLGALRLRAQGRGGLVAAIVHGGWTFVRGYLLRLGLLDGRAGLAIAWLNARGTFLRYRLAGLPAAARSASGESR